MTTPASPDGEDSTLKARYKVTNWREYDRALVRQGSLDIWFDEEFVREHRRPADLATLLWTPLSLSGHPVLEVPG